MIRFAVITRVPDAKRGDSLLGNLEKRNIFIVDHKETVGNVEDYLPAGLADSLRLPIFELGQIVMVDQDLCDLVTGRALALYDISYEVFLGAAVAIQKSEEVTRKLEFARLRDG